MNLQVLTRLKGILFLLGGLLLGVALGALVLYSGPSQPGSTSRRTPPTVGSPVPDFTLALLDGEGLASEGLASEGDEARLSELKGRPVVINFWATWCAPCEQEMPLLQQYADRYEGQLALLGVDYEEDESVVREFVTEREITFPILLDRSGIVANQYYVRNFPTTFFVDSEGVLRAQHLGMLTEELLEKYLKTIGINP